MDNNEIGKTAVCMEGYEWKRKKGTRHADNRSSRRRKLLYGAIIGGESRRFAPSELHDYLLS